MQLLVEANTKHASRRLERLEKRLGGSTELMGAIAEVIEKDNEKRFRRVKLAPATVEYKAKYGKSAEPLVESGQMRRELTTEQGIRLITDTELRYGSKSLAEGEGRGRQITVSKAKLSQKGTKHQRKRIVQRPTPTTRAEIARLVDEFITHD